MAELRGLDVGYEVPISKSLQQTAGNVGLGQLQTEIKVSLTTKKRSQEKSVSTTFTLLWEISQPCY